MMMTFDLVIIGGGLVGAGLARALRDLPLNIALVDAAQPKENDPRLFALNQTSCQFLENLSLFDSLREFASPIHAVHVSRKKYFGAVRLKREDVSLPALGYVVPACHIESALNAALETQNNLTIIRPAQLTGLNASGKHLTLESNEGVLNISTRVLVAADGTHSTVRKLMQIKTNDVDYAQSAIVTKTTLSKCHDHVAYERFTPKGTIAMLPLPNNQCATIWSGDTSTMHELMALADQDFVCALHAEFGSRLGTLQSIEKRHIFALHGVNAASRSVHHVFLLGNAAHTLHPVAAQGFNLALYEVAQFAELLQSQLAEKNNMCEVSLAAAFKALHVSTSRLSLSHRLAKWTHSQSLTLHTIMQLGLISMDMITPVKKRFIENMLGRVGPVPRLLLSMSDL